jgi:hypothetical protein
VGRLGVSAARSAAEHVGGTAGYESAAPVVDSRKLRMSDVDGDIRPRLESERDGTAGGAHREQLVDSEDVSAT